MLGRYNNNKKNWSISRDNDGVVNQDLSMDKLEIKSNKKLKNLPFFIFLLLNIL